jgi:hypothetical protein
MNLNVIGSGLLAILGLPLIFRYGILPGETTPYWLFTLLLFGVLGNIVLAYRGIRTHIFTLALMVTIVSLVIGTQIVNRGRIAPGQNMGTHDVILQLESALRFLGDGKNPYAVTYFGTPLEQWHYAEGIRGTVNPALYHFVMPPWYIIFSYPFYFISMRLLGYFDGRMPLLFCVLGIIVVLRYLFRDKALGNIAAMLVVLAPGTVDYLVEGRSDMFALFWVLLSCFLLVKKSYLLAFGFFALAFWSKQTVWFLAPLFFWYAYLATGEKRKKLLFSIILFIGLSFLLVGPFLMWDIRAFMDSVIFYLSGNSKTGYPISGYGLGMLLYSLGIIRSVHDFYPFAIWQLAAGIPLLIFAFKFLARYATLSRLLLSHAILLFGVWYTSRYFNNSHALYIVVLFMLAILLDQDERAIRYGHEK